jgi:hypothetical protein
VGPAVAPADAAANTITATTAAAAAAAATAAAAAAHVGPFSGLGVRSGAGGRPDTHDARVIATRRKP